MKGEGSRRVRVRRVRDAAESEDDDAVAVEEPMEIRIIAARDPEAPRSVSVTMRTPGEDLELAAGFLFTEGILRGLDDLRSVRQARAAVHGNVNNVVDVILADHVSFDPTRLERHFYVSSSCGVCGKASLDAVRVLGLRPLDPSRPRVPRDLVGELPERLRQRQTLFASTGGLHAAGLFDSAGDLIAVREDVGRHNAVDKVVGSQLLAGRVPLQDNILVVSGRASFEILQKAAVAGIPFIIAVGAPSSLAVDVAREFGMTLVGFARGRAFNVYAGAERILVRVLAARAAVSPLS